jgi:hypothetical protein
MDLKSHGNVHFHVNFWKGIEMIIILSNKLLNYIPKKKKLELELYDQRKSYRFMKFILIVQQILNF